MSHGLMLGVVERHLHGVARAFDGRLHHVLAVGRHAVADELGEDGRAAALGVLVFLEDEDAGAFAEHRAVALLGEREAALRRQHVEGLPGFHGAVVDDCFGSARNGDVDDIVLDVVARDADGVSRRRAGAAGGERRSLDSVLDADVGRRGRADDAKQRQRIGGALIVDEEIAVGVLERHQAAGARTDDAGRAIGVLDGKLEARLSDGLSCRIGGKPRVAIGHGDDAVALVALEANLGLVVFDLRRDQDLKILERKAAQLAYAGFALHQRRPKLVDVETDRRDYAHACDDNAPRAVRLCHGFVHSCGGGAGCATQKRRPPGAASADKLSDLPNVRLRPSPRQGLPPSNP